YPAVDSPSPAGWEYILSPLPGGEGLGVGERGECRASALASTTPTLPSPSTGEGNVRRGNLQGDFEYVIVGAGSAGCVLAARLTEDPKTRVLLLEAGGGADQFLIRMPLGMMKAMLKPELTWRMMTEPEPTLNGRRLFLPRGRLLGGASSSNGM